MAQRDIREKGGQTRCKEIGNEADSVTKTGSVWLLMSPDFFSIAKVREIQI